METLDPNLSPKKRLKTETLTPPSPISTSSAKGKAPIDEFLIDDDDGDGLPEKLRLQNCGICFCEEGKSVRGFIESCNHYFCFLCIVEWSKIESRCPLCRARFSTIRRMRKDGSFIGEGSVRVPVRDQIYDPFGEPVDPYSQAKCTVCNGTNDESLLLLCDLCDSAWHTYCVGLAATVPEGDWFCRDCALLRAEECNGEMDDNVDNSTSSEHVDGTPSTSAPVSIFDIVREPKEPESGVSRLLKLVSSHPKKFSLSATASDQVNIAYTGQLPATVGNLTPPVDVTESSARTLHNCRNVHRSINVLRENWDAFRAGSLSFSGDLSGSVGERSRKMNMVSAFAERASKLPASSSSSSLQSKAQDVSCDDMHDKQSYNVYRAWKLMKIAKSMKVADKPKSVSRTSCNKLHSLTADNIASKCVPFGRKNPVSGGMAMQKPNDKVGGRLGQRSGKHHLTSIFTEAASTSSSSYQNSCMPRLSSSRKAQGSEPADISHDRAGLPSFGKLGRALSTVFDDGSICSTSGVSCAKLQRKDVFKCQGEGEHFRTANICITSKAEAQTSVPTDNCHGRGALRPQTKLDRGLSIVSGKPNGSACSTSPYGHLVDTSDASYVKSNGKEVCGSPRNDGANITGKVIKDDEAKSEIQALVKLNLKLLSKDKRLEADAFKEIARLSTHTILAACGFQHRKIVRSLPTLVCSHGDQFQQFRRSILMPSSCRECFYIFVKDIVRLIMLEKLNSTGVAC